MDVAALLREANVTGNESQPTAELFAALYHELHRLANRLGDIVGEPSAGTNGNVNPFTLPGGYGVMWTGMLVEKRDGTPHHGVGVIPTVPVSATVAGVRSGRDEILERAVALVAPTGTPPPNASGRGLSR